jgi:hypothetical protein
MSQCNFCNLRWMRRHAAKEGKVVTLVHETTTEMGGIDVLVHDEGETPDRSKHFRAWFAALSETCCC